MKTLVTVTTVCALSLSACSTWGTKVPMGGVKFPPVPTDHVMILFEAPSRPYDQIGIVSSIGGVYASDGDMYRKMQMAAADLGADAIIVQGAAPTIKTEGGVTVVQTQSVKTYWDYPKTSAIAIKYK
jgi:hypothetical protein